MDTGPGSCQDRIMNRISGMVSGMRGLTCGTETKTSYPKVGVSNPIRNKYFFIILNNSMTATTVTTTTYCVLYVRSL